MTADGHSVFWDDGSGLELEGMVARSDFPKSHQHVYFKKEEFKGCKLYLNWAGI